MASQISRSVCNSNFRYSGDVLSLNHSRFGDYRRIMYPNELDVNDTTDTQNHVSYLDLYLEIDNGERLKAKLYDKRDEFTFPIITFPIISSNIPASTAYGVYISQHMRYSRACDFFDRAHLLTQQVLEQGDAGHYTIQIPLSSSFVYVTSIASHLTLIMLRNNQLINKTRRSSLPEHLGSPPNYRLTQSFVFCIVFVCHCLSFFFLVIVLSDLL